MSLTNLLISLILGFAAFWTYSHSKAEPPTKEIVCACSVVIILVSFTGFVVSAPWFLNLALLLVIMAIWK